MAEQKTNVMRFLDQKKVPYIPHEYPHGDEAVDGVTVAGLIGKEPESVFKTLVARGASKSVYVFVIPVRHELDLKRAAKAAGEKSVEMVRVSEINALTGYVRGGCSPLGAKKAYPVYLDASAEKQSTISISAGKRGEQIVLAPADLIRAANATVAKLNRHA